jgi:catechol 2,3-dioxygenase-like lactoylglutathione lyase family enzyme
MPIHAIAHYNFRVERGLMETLREFYEQVVGLRVGPRPAFSSFGYWLYAGDADLLHLSEQEAHDRRRTGTDLTFDHVALACSGWPEFEARLSAAGLAYTLDRVPGSGRLQVFFRDPAGNGIELIFPEGED